MGVGASARLAEAEGASARDLVPGKEWRKEALDSVVIVGDCAIIGLAALGQSTLDAAVPFSEKGDRKLVAIVDSCRCDLWYKFHSYTGCFKNKEIDIFVILMPGIDSDPRCYGVSLTQSMTAPSFICLRYSRKDIRFVYRDYYFANPITTTGEIPVFLLDGNVVTPASKRSSMIGWVDSWKKTWYNKLRAGVHHAAGFMEDGMGLFDGSRALKKLLTEGEGAKVDFKGLPAAKTSAPGGSLPDKPDLLQYPQSRILFAFGGLHGQADCLEQFDPAKEYPWKEWRDGAYDITIFANPAEWTREMHDAIALLRYYTVPSILTVVLVAKDIDGFKIKEMVMYLNTMLEQCDTVVFSTLDQIDAVKSVFLPSSPLAPNGLVLALGMISFPRLHFFTVLTEDGKTCGVEVGDGSLIFSSMKFGLSAPTLDATKLAPSSLVQGSSGPIHYLTLPGDNKATVIQPTDVLLKIIDLALQGGLEEVSRGGHRGTDLAVEAESNVNDLIAEIRQYAAIRESSDDD